MLYIIDEQTGNCFNADNSVYITYLKGVQSVGLGYVEKIFILSDKENIVAEVPNDSIFSIVDIDLKSDTKFTNTDQCEINSYKYYDINEHLTKKFTSKGVKADCAVDNAWIHCLHMYVLSPYVGTCIEEISVSDLNKKKVYTLRIGGDFYDENEVYKINLENFGIEIPQQFVKAIYQTNVHEDSIDTVTLNRKRKELLCEYKNLEFQKGNYNSLLNYLAWFEYGDKIRISEYWKILDPYRDQLQEKDLQQLMTEHLFERLDTHAKTTMLGIHTALQKLMVDKDGNIKYESMDDERFAHVKGDLDMLYARSTANFDPDITERENLRDKETKHHFDEFEVTSSTPEKQSIMRSQPLRDGSTWWQLKADEDNMFIAESIPLLSNVAFMWSYEDIMLKMRLLAEFYSTYCMPIHMDLIQCSIEGLAIGTIKQIRWQTQYQVQSFTTYNVNLNVELTQDLVIDSDIDFQNHEDKFDTIPWNEPFYRGVGVIGALSVSIDGNTSPIKKVMVNDFVLSGNKYELQHTSYKYLMNDGDTKYKIAFLVPGKHIVQVMAEDYNGLAFTETKEVTVHDATMKKVTPKILVKNYNEPTIEDMKSYCDYVFNMNQDDAKGGDRTFNIDFSMLKKDDVGTAGLSRVIKSTVELNGMDDFWEYHNEKLDKYLYISKKFYDYKEKYEIETAAIEDKIDFVPMMNLKKDIEDYVPFGSIVALCPEYRSTKKHNATWKLTNKSTLDQKTYECTCIHEPMFGQLDKGWYRLDYSYCFGGEEVKKSISKIFIVK